MLARLQRGICLALLLVASGVLLCLWERGLWVAVAGFLAVVFSYALVFAIEFIALNRISLGDRVRPARASELLRAWWRESIVAFQIFGWRQPFRPNAVPDQLVPASASQCGVVLVHGFVCNRGFWTPWLKQLRSRGHPFIAVNLEPVFTGIDNYVPLLEQAINEVTRVTGQPPLLVCHSMGGLVARAWFRSRPDAEARVAHIVTIGSPHHGTWFARFSHGPNGRQMQRHSAWLRQLAADEPASRYTRFTCWYSNADNIVAPASSATLPGADNRLLAGAGHVDLAYRPALLRDTLARLAEYPV